MRKLLIITPTYNEEKNIGKLIQQIFSLQNKINHWEINLLVVDSHSQDKTAEEVKKLQKKYPRLYLLETEKRGLGKAYVEGYRWAFSQINPYLIIQMDADLSHQSKYIFEFIKKIENGADLAIGSRYIAGGSIPKNWAWYRKLLSYLGNLIIRLGFANFRITDWTSGYRAIRAWVIKEIVSETKKYSGYVFQIATIDQALKKQARVTEIPIKFIDRQFGSSKIKFGEYIFNIFGYLFTQSSFIKFIIVGTIGFLIDFSLSFLLIEKLHFKLWLATTISAEAAIISNFLLNNFWSFAHKKLDHQSIIFFFNFLKFNFISLGSLIIQAVGLEILGSFFGKQWWIIYKVFIIGFIIIPYSFVLYNKMVWKKNNYSSFFST